MTSKDANGISPPSATPAPRSETASLVPATPKAKPSKLALSAANSTTPAKQPAGDAKSADHPSAAFPPHADEARFAVATPKSVATPKLPAVEVSAGAADVEHARSGKGKRLNIAPAADRESAAKKRKGNKKPSPPSRPAVPRRDPSDQNRQAKCMAAAKLATLAASSPSAPAPVVSVTAPRIPVAVASASAPASASAKPPSHQQVKPLEPSEQPAPVFKRYGRQARV